VTCETVLEAGAVGLLTGSPPDPDVQEHLDGCATCRAELAELAPLPGLLASAAAQVAEMDEQPPGDALLERLLAAASAERRSRRHRLRMIAVSSIAALAVVLVPTALVLANRSAPPPAVAADKVQAQASDHASGIFGQVTLARSAWGSAMTLHVNGVPTGTQCTVVIVTRSGARETAMTWWVQYPGPATVQGTVAADVPAIASVDLVQTGSGKVLLRMPMPG
jgi:hypothetical protein